MRLVALPQSPLLPFAVVDHGWHILRASTRELCIGVRGANTMEQLKTYNPSWAFGEFRDRAAANRWQRNRKQGTSREVSHVDALMHCLGQALCPLSSIAGSSCGLARGLVSRLQPLFLAQPSPQAC